MKRFLALAVIGLVGAFPAWANSIASVVVRDSGDIYFSDYVRDRIWKVDARGELTVALAHRHTFHLVHDVDGTIYGESRSARGGAEATIWRLDASGRSDEVFRPAQWGRSVSYRGTVFTIDRKGSLIFVRDCQLVRMTAEGLVPLTSGRCAENAWSNEVIVYGHLHGSLAWGPDDTLYFSDGRTIRRIASDGAVTTMTGKPTTLFAPPQPGEERFDALMGLDVDARGTVYAADQRRRAILRFGPDGRATVVVRLGLFWSPTALAVSGGSVYVLVNLRFVTPAFLSGAFGNPTLQRISEDGRIRNDRDRPRPTAVTLPPGLIVESFLLRESIRRSPGPGPPGAPVSAIPRATSSSAPPGAAERGR